MLKRSLVNWLYHDAEHKVLFRFGDVAIVKRSPFDPAAREIGRDYSIHAHTLV